MREKERARYVERAGRSREMVGSGVSVPPGPSGEEGKTGEATRLVRESRVPAPSY